MEINKTHNEDCLKTMNRMPDNFVDLTITSPPYDAAREYDKLISGKTNFNGYSFDFENIAKELYRITKVGGVVVWVVGDTTTKGSESGSSFRQALYFKEIGFNLFDTMIYQKLPRGAVGNNKGYWQTFEYMFILSKGNPKTTNLIIDRKNKTIADGHTSTKRLKDGSLVKTNKNNYGEYGRRTNIWEYSTGKNHSTKDEIAFKHPAIMPELLVKDHIYTWSNENDLIYDPFMGSGTVAKMALLDKRSFIGSEISEEYCKIAEERIVGIK
jgi:site-specific DNA-methyltransferase (adenine-specific)